MSDVEQSDPSEASDLFETDGSSGRARSQRSARRSEVATIRAIGVAVTVLLAIGVVIAALDMKFQADQARWQQRQTCLAWYRLQADYGLGPWYEKLPAAAEDCGGGETIDGVPAVPGGTGPAVIKSDVPSTASTTAITTTTTAVILPPDGSDGP